MRAAIPILAALALLAGCGPRPAAGPTPADRAQAQAALDRLKTVGGQVLGLAPPSNLPANLVLPPDGFVTSAGQGEAGPASGWLEFSTALTPGAATAFYELALTAAGLKVVRAAPAAGTQGLIASGRGRTVNLTVRGLDGVGAEVRLSYS